MSTTFKIKSGDFDFEEATGKIVQVSGAAKAIQDFVEEMMTDYDPETDRGSKIRQLDSIGLMRQEIAETFDRLKNRQYTNKSLDSKEQLNKIENLVVESYDQINVFFYVSVSTIERDVTSLLLVLTDKGELVQVDHQLLPFEMN